MLILQSLSMKFGLGAVHTPCLSFLPILLFQPRFALLPSWLSLLADLCAACWNDAPVAAAVLLPLFKRFSLSLLTSNCIFYGCILIFFIASTLSNKYG